MEDIILSLEVGFLLRVVYSGWLAEVDLFGFNRAVGSR